MDPLLENLVFVLGHKANASLNSVPKMLHVGYDMDAALAAADAADHSGEFEQVNVHRHIDQPGTLRFSFPPKV